MVEGKISVYSSVDVMKIICSILVIVIHTRPLQGIIGCILTNGIARIAVPFFFLSAGYFFYEGCKSNSRYCNKYLMNIFKTYTIWYVIYLIWRILFESQSSSLKEIILLIREYLFSGYYQLWYMPSLIISILFVYIFIKRNKYSSLIVFSIILYFIGLFGDSYAGLINNEIFNYILKLYTIIFGASKVGLCFGVPMITLGVIINKHI